VALGVAAGGALGLFADDYFLQTEYANGWFLPGPPGGGYTNYFGTTPSTAIYGGHVLGNTTSTLPTGGAYGLQWSAFGHPVEGIQADLAIGDFIAPPPGALTNVPPANFVAVKMGDNATAFYECSDPKGGAFWVPSTGQVIAAQPNNITIEWRLAGGGTFQQVVNVSAVPVKRPARLFWTESPYDAPLVNMSGLFPVIHYSTAVPPPVLEVVTNENGGLTSTVTNVVRGVWLDDQKQLHAKGVSGLFIIEYYEEGSYARQVQPDGIEVVQVLEPDLQLVTAHVGARLRPLDTYWADVDGINGLLPNVTEGLNETAYVHTQTGPKDQWVFAIKRTWREPWMLEIYWQHRGRMGVVWPYEVDWYSCDWPPHPQRYVLGDNPPGDTAPVLIPAEVSAELMKDMDPSLHASLSASGRSFTASQPGTCLLKYTTHDNLWFEVVRSVRRTDPGYFEETPLPWPIGEELVPSDPAAHALNFDGTDDHLLVGQSLLNRRDQWTLALWFNTARLTASTLYSEGNPAVTFSVGLTAAGQLQVGTYHQAHKAWTWATTTNAPVHPRQWHHLAVAYRDGSDTNGTLRLHLDDFTWETNNVPWPSADGVGQTVMAGQWSGSTKAVTSFFPGRLDEVRLWRVPLDSDQVRSNRYVVAPATAAELITDFPFDEGQGEVLRNRAGDHDATAMNGPVWCAGQVLPIGTLWTGYPGYLYQPMGQAYNVNRYQYPTESAPRSASQIFGVNTGLLEVWWANRSRQPGLPALYYPSRVQRYQNVWPADAPDIVLASGLGSSGSSVVPSGEALQLFGAGSSYVVTRHQAVLNSAAALSAEAWVKVTDPSPTQYLLHRSGQFYLALTGGTLAAQFYVPDGRHFSVSGGVVPSNEWVHVACTIGQGQIDVYLNAQLVGSTAIGGWTLADDLAADLFIGRAAGGDQAFLGTLGEVRLWNTSRSAAQIAGSWRAELRGDEDGLVAWYPFVRLEDPSQLADAGPYGLPGEIHDASWTSPGRPRSVLAGPLAWGSPSIYQQNNPGLPGYNPNEEHALVLGGVAYALRHDLNTATSSEPYVLVDYLDPATLRPRMLVFRVLATNEVYTFDRALTAGHPIEPIMPLGALPLCTLTDSPTQPPAWRDRKLAWWAVSAGDDDGPATAVMQFYYQMQPTFYFPALPASQQPRVGQELPWLPSPSGAGGTTGPPVHVRYQVTWPTDLPELQLGQTLTLPTAGLPDIWNQLSVDVTYDQSARVFDLPSVLLFDPLADREVDLPQAAVQAMVQSQLARQELTSSLIRFPELPPSLYPRLFYDPHRGQAGQLALEGQRMTTLTGDGYLLLNLLEDFEKDGAKAMAAPLDDDPRGQWNRAIENLPGDLYLITNNFPYVKAALGARLTNGVGYVTLAFNNSTNRPQVPPALPVSLSIIRVVPELYTGELEAILPDDALAEQLSLRYSADLAGQIEEVEFEWRWADPVSGVLPNKDFEGSPWLTYGTGADAAANEVALTGASPFTLSDHYFAVRYRPRHPIGPTGDAWSGWSYTLAPGWVKRAMTGINPFEQIFHDPVSQPVDTRVSMISQAGGPYQGHVALNLDAASSSGLIATYQTIFNRAKAFGLEIGSSDPNLNQTLLFAASRLRDLYTLLGHEAYADALDPTIAFPRSLAEDQHGADATSLFAFMNQVPNLLAEELALLRGRDDTLEPSVGTAPIYNRLIWNFTQGINGGEAAYAYNYNLRGSPTNTSGLITAEDAKRLYPQGHGDAWGHYLSAITPYYDLLSYTNFAWHTEAEATLVGNAPVTVDYLDEQKFAETAAARARVGAAIVQLTFRQSYSEDPDGRWPGYTDARPERAWGLGEWASRAGQAAYYDWAVAHSLLLDHLTNRVQIGGDNQPLEGIQRIDRASTPELREIAASLRDVQTQTDSANGGLNPLGLARNVVPFDIDPAALDAGQTHFEQIYDRALQALYNACVAFDHARSASRQLREQSDSLYDLEESLAQSELDYHNRLIELYGYPYPDDVGAGKTYPQGYDGPDLINWRILDLENLLAGTPTGVEPIEVEVRNLRFLPGSDFASTSHKDYEHLAEDSAAETNVVGRITVYGTRDGLQVKPADWKGRRPALGELQLALSDYVQTWYALQAKMADYDQSLAGLESDLQRRLSEYARYPDEWTEHEKNEKKKQDTARIVSGLKIAATLSELVAESIKDGGELVAELLPHIESGALFIGPYFGTLLDVGAIAKVALGTTYYLSLIAAHSLEAGAEGRQMEQEVADADLEMLLKGNEYYSLLRWNTADTMVKLKEQYVKQAELFAQIEALTQSYQRVEKLLAQGQRLLTERAQVRVRASQRLQSQRYADLGFRIFRDDALRRYQSTFELAARYTYLAAKAYDYETGLLYSDTTRTPGARFLEQVVRARLPGRFYVWLGTPMAGSPTGEPGLADILARMKADWDVVKGRFGFNNPDLESTTFSLRTELWRISLATNGNPVWAQALESCRVPDLRQLPEFRRYCRPFSDTTAAEPGLVIAFPSAVIAGKNYFGNDLAGGDNAYDPSHAATKIRSAGVWFYGYNTTFNTNAIGAGLANEPRVYLVPVGEDVLRSPTRGGQVLRHWTVFNQALPLPYNIGHADLDCPDWIPVMDSLREPFAQIRRFASFRAYHDSGLFDDADTRNNGRLVGRSVWNTRWLLIIPGRTLLSDPQEGLDRFLYGALVNGVRDGKGVKDIQIRFRTYSIGGD
jgi:hypothetical protein